MIAAEPPDCYPREAQSAEESFERGSLLFCFLFPIVSKARFFDETGVFHSINTPKTPVFSDVIEKNTENLDKVRKQLSEMEIDEGEGDKTEKLKGSVIFRKNQFCLSIIIP